MSRSVASWLFICAALLFITTQVGAITRLTESGLSIVEWKPVTGAMPPLNEADWTHEFTLYQASPQYQQVNAGMTLESFKQIYFWEWLHRLLDRLLGMVYFLPLIYFWRAKKLPDNTKKSLAVLFLLGAAQGTLGWAMVKSGLEHRPAVSHYLLAAHLMLAVTIFCGLLRMGFVFSVTPTLAKLEPLRKHLRITVAMVALTMIWGAFTAGLRAGLLYGDTFPLMGAHLWPGEMFDLTPTIINLFENPAAVQFTHRVLAILTFCTLLAVASRGMLREPASKLCAALGVMAFVQAGLGITTLVSHVNVFFATLHQAGAIIILALLMTVLHNIPCKGDNNGTV